MTPDALVMIGCGWIARRHAEAARRLGWPVIFASRDPVKARRYAREFRGVGAYGDYGEALRDPRALCTIVCTPHDRHVTDALGAFAAGRHVLLEKPIARTLGEADQVIEAAEAAGLVLMIGENFHFMPAFRHVRGLLDAGGLGDLREIHLVARGFRRSAGWRGDAALAGGGALIDGGIHYVHNLRWWGGEVRRIFALRPPPTHEDFGAEDAIALLAILENGVLGFLANSLAAPGVGRMQWSTVTGTRASAYVDNRGRFVVVRGSGRLRLRYFRRDQRGHEAMLTAFRDAIASGHRPESDGASGRRDLEVVLAAYRSVAERAPVDLAC
jgi:predicted dehydrogenase